MRQLMSLQSPSYPSRMAKRAAKKGDGPWGDAIQYWFREKNLRQSHVVEGTGMSPNKASRAANGLDVRMETLRQFAEFFGVPLESVLVSPQRRLGARRGTATARQGPIRCEAHDDTHAPTGDPPTGRPLVAGGRSTTRQVAATSPEIGHQSDRRLREDAQTQERQRRQTFGLTRAVITCDARLTHSLFGFQRSVNQHRPRPDCGPIFRPACSGLSRLPPSWDESTQTPSRRLKK